ncbi:hypothetical protein CHKEEEPN_0825 [Methylorubrum podarium]|nr:hypothetical protein CHKEEEPN_0825 [Methylorubrum podarium]
MAKERMMRASLSTTEAGSRAICGPDLPVPRTSWVWPKSNWSSTSAV